MDWLERKVEPRLKVVAGQIEGPVLADIGSDHGFLPAYVLRRQLVERVIVVEKSEGPFMRARRALSRVAAEVRLGDGLEPLRPGEVDCLSMTGFGARMMVRILSAYPQRLPPRVVVQPNDNPEVLRRWGLDHGYHLQAERLVAGPRVYGVLTLQKREGADPAYQRIPLALALAWGPHLLRRRCDILATCLLQQRQRLQDLRGKRWELCLEAQAWLQEM